jgi:dipeptidyl aminopeptidase/acylaminoacyl peptidase
MNIKYPTLIFCLFYLFTANSQDAKIISRKPYFVPDTSIQKLQKIIPDIQSIINAVNFYSITYFSDGLRVTGYLAVPKKQGKYPSIIYNRGGNRDFGAITDMAIVRMLGNVANWGYVCIASQYRGNMGSEGKEEFGGKDVNDVLNLIPCLSAIDQADTSRIGMFGWSRGGMETYLALTRTCRIKAAVIVSGAADPFMTIKKRPGMDSVFMELAPEYFQNRDSTLKARSAVNFADKICPSTPLLLLTSSADWRVSPEEQIEMMTKLYELRHPVRFEMFEGGSHGLIEHYDEVNHSIKSFLDRCYMIL